MQDLRTVKLTVISDLICPWCFIGHRELEKAIAQCAALPIQFELEYRPYRVNLSLNEDLSICRDTYFANKYGQEKLDGMKKIVGERGASLGINFKWGGKFSQTTRAHRLLYKAWQMGGQQLQQRLLVLLFKAHFEQTEDIGSVEMLSDRAEQVGMYSKESALDFLESDECLEEVTKMMQESRINGVTGVPFTVIDGKWAVSGGQSSDVYVQIFQKLAASYIQEQTTPRPVQALPPVVCA